MRNPATLSPSVAALFDCRVVATELREPGDPRLLYPAEAAACERFAPARRAEFAAGRLCARRALHEWGIDDFALEINTDRSPRWPAGMAGSITHTGAFCAAAVAPTGNCASLGLDAETIGRITPEMQRLIFTADESALLDTLAAEQRATLETTIFSAKEAFYKCQFPLTHAWRDFVDVRLEFAHCAAAASAPRTGGTFLIHPSRETTVRDWGTGLPLAGRFTIDAERVITAVAVA